jgi:hypothetical protein
VRKLRPCSSGGPDVYSVRKGYGTCDIGSTCARDRSCITARWAQGGWLAVFCHTSHLIHALVLQPKRGVGQRFARARKKKERVYRSFYMWYVCAAARVLRSLTARMWRGWLCCSGSAQRWPLFVSDGVMCGWYPARKGSGLKGPLCCCGTHLFPSL